MIAIEFLGRTAFSLGFILLYLEYSDAFTVPAVVIATLMCMATSAFFMAVIHNDKG